MASGPVDGEVLCFAFCAPPYSAGTCGPIDPGTSCVMEIRFDPAAPGTYPATMDIGDAAGFVRIAVTGRGTGLQAPPSMTFAPSPRGSPSSASTLTVTNTGDQPTGVITAQLVGADFEILTNACRDLALPAGESCLVTMRGVARAVSGTLTGELRLSAIPGGAITTALRGSAE